MKRYNIDNFEKRNARAWEEESNASFATDVPTRAAPSQLQAAPPGFRLKENSRFASLDAHKAERSGENGPHTPPSRGAQQKHSTTALRGHYKFTSRGPHKQHAQHWPDDGGLVSTRRALDQETKKHVKIDKEKYLKPKVDGERTTALGFYIWPQDDGNIVEVLGSDLAHLNAIRMEERVYIELCRETGLPDALKISSDSTNWDRHLTQAIKGIRAIVKDARAKVVLATPKYFIIPPTAAAMRAFIGPQHVQTQTIVVDGIEQKKNSHCIGTELVGSNLSDCEKKAWREKHSSLMNAYINDIKGQLMNGMMTLAPLKAWMRMRVHFGHLHLKRFEQDFVAAQMSMDKFSHMMRSSKARGEVDKRIPAGVAIKLIKRILDWPQRFQPAQGTVVALQDVLFNHTEFIFVTNRRGDKLRVEADIDVNWDVKGFCCCQPGAQEVFRDDHRNKCIELSTIDPERQLDFTLQVITDSIAPNDEYSEERHIIESIVAGSMSPKTTKRVDALGLPFPEIHPRSSSALPISDVVLKSVVQYALMNLGYIIEIAIYRSWPDLDTRWNPQLTAAVSMFHPEWDNHMGKIEEGAQSRGWDRELKKFFNNSEVDNDKGFENFLAEVQTIQGFLCDATEEAEREDAELIAREAALEAERVAADEFAAEAERMAAEAALEEPAR